MNHSSLLSRSRNAPTLVQASLGRPSSGRASENDLAVPSRMAETEAMAEEHFVEPAPASPAEHAGEASERASDADRDRVVSLLRDHCAVGRLTLDEFSERTGAALVARTRGDLDAVLADLPTSLWPLAQVPRRRARRWIVAVMGESESKGRWRLGEHTSVVAVMGECHLDLSQAEIDGPDIVITARWHHGIDRDRHSRGNRR